VKGEFFGACARASGGKKKNEGDSFHEASLVSTGFPQRQTAVRRRGMDNGDLNIDENGGLDKAFLPADPVGLQPPRKWALEPLKKRPELGNPGRSS
jgi:hypothetical protein